MSYSNTLKLLQQAVGGENREDQISILKGKPFWVWDNNHHYLQNIEPDAQCCFNHIVGLPQKDGHDMPLLPYQKRILNDLETYRRIVILKSRGLGLSELLIRFYIYSAINRFSPYSNLLIIAGNREKVAIDLLNRLKRIITQKLAPDYFKDSNLTTAQIGSSIIEVIPSRIQDIRGKAQCKAVWLDEADYLDPAQANFEVRPAIEGLISKPNSNPEVVFSSTPRAPGSLMDNLMREEFYHKLTFPYTAGIQDAQGNPLPFPVYNSDELRLQRQSPNWQQEYECEFIGQYGNVIDFNALNRALRLGKLIGCKVIPECKRSIGIDPTLGGSGSDFAICVTQLQGGRIVVTHAEHYSKPLNDFTISRVIEIIEECGGAVPPIYVDASNQSYIKTLRHAIGEDISDKTLEIIIANSKKYHTPLSKRLKVIGVPFGTAGSTGNSESMNMLMRMKSLIEHRKGLVAIDGDRFPDLVIAIRTCRAENFRLQKEDVVFSDLLDAFRISLCRYEFVQKASLNPPLQ